MILESKIFNSEIAMCQKHFQKKGKCKWGECAKCGVIPLLFKLGKGELYEDEKEITNLKEKTLNPSL
jgi:hypothetical protein